MLLKDCKTCSVRRNISFSSLQAKSLRINTLESSPIRRLNILKSKLNYLNVSAFVSRSVSEKVRRLQHLLHELCALNSSARIENSAQRLVLRLNLPLNVHFVYLRMRTLKQTSPRRTS